MSKIKTTIRTKWSSNKSFQGDRKKNLELDIANAKYRESEASNQSLKIQLENFERKVTISYVQIYLFLPIRYQQLITIVLVNQATFLVNFFKKYFA